MVNLFTKVAKDKEKIYDQFKKAVLAALECVSFLFDERERISKKDMNEMEEDELVKALGLAFSYMHKSSEDAANLKEDSESVYQFLKRVEGKFQLDEEFKNILDPEITELPLRIR